jgi:hypothetical protein
MSKHLLRKLLKLDTDESKSQNKNEEKYVRYYSTDKGRSVTTKIPKHMNIIQPNLTENTQQSYTDDLSDVSSHLLNKIIRQQNIERFGLDTPTKPLTYYSNKDNTKSIPSIYSDIEMSDITSRHSGNFSSKSSFDSNRDTSYDSFFDMYDKYQDKNKRQSKDSDVSTFNIFKASHRENPEKTDWSEF